jgi:tryptophanyl-tRNA synthetase
MASDILSFDAEIVPVGKDQSQHLEYASDMAKLFNNATKKNVFREPKPQLQETPSLLGTDGRKMSKSYHNTIPLFAPKKELEKAVKEIKTDSLGLNDPKNPEECLVYLLLKSFGSADAVSYMKERLEKGVGYGYGHAKQDFLAEHERVFGAKRELYQHYLGNQKEVRDLLQDGYARCQSYAQHMTARSREALGLKSYL